MSNNNKINKQINKLINSVLYKHQLSINNAAMAFWDIPDGELMENLTPLYTIKKDSPHGDQNPPLVKKVRGTDYL